MPAAKQGLVHIVRDFLDAHRLMRRLFSRTHEGLLFEELQELVSDSDASVLFRLKERCHELFREQGSRSALADRETLFDLAVGSLFHEAMSFRENFYQREVYGPRVRALREHADPDSVALFDEFEKILGAVEGRVTEGRDEASALLDQTALQLRRLLVLHAENGLVTRFLVEHAEQAEAVFGLSFPELLDEIHGSAATGYGRAADSYLEGGHYEAAASAFERASAHAGDGSLDAKVAFARGLAAYLDRNHAVCVAELTRWADGNGSASPENVRLAQGVLAGALPLAQEEGAAEVCAAAAALLERLESVEPSA